MQKKPVLSTVATQNAPPPAGHYAQAVGDGTIFFVSGQLPVSLDRIPRPDLAFPQQVRMALGNLLAIVEATGATREQIMKITAFIVGVEHWPSFNDVYAEMLGGARPARSVVPVPALHHDCLVELEAIVSIK